MNICSPHDEGLAVKKITANSSRRNQIRMRRKRFLHMREVEVMKS